jgi:hypothetical protein
VAGGFFFFIATDGTMCPGVDSASKNEYQDTPWDKDGWCVGVTTLPHSVPKIRSLDLPDPQGPAHGKSFTVVHLIYDESSLL